MAALQRSTAELQGKTNALEASNAALSSTHSTLRETHSSLLSDHSTLSAQHRATSSLLSSYQAELAQAQKTQADLHSMLKVEGEQTRSWRDQCEALEQRLKDAEAAAKADADRAQAALAKADQSAAAAAIAAAAAAAREAELAGRAAELQGRAASGEAAVQRLMEAERELRATAAALAEREREVRGLTAAYEAAVAGHSAQAGELLAAVQGKQAELEAAQAAHIAQRQALEAQLGQQQALLLQTDAMNAELAAYVEAVKPQLPDLRLTAALVAGFKGDYLGANRDAQLLAMIFANGDKAVVFSDGVTRWDHRTHPQPRLLVLTEAHLYCVREKTSVLDVIHSRHVKPKDMRRCVRLENVVRVGASPSKAGVLVVHVDDRYDYLLECAKRAELLYWLMKAFEAKVGKALRVEWGDELFVRDRGQMFHREVKVVASEKVEIGKKAKLTPAELKEIKQ